MVRDQRLASKMEGLPSLPRKDQPRGYRGMRPSNAAARYNQYLPRDNYEKSTKVPLKDQTSPHAYRTDPTLKKKYFDKWTRFRTKMNKGLIEMITNPKLKRRINKGAVPFFRADKNMCHFALDQATEEYLEGRKLNPILMAETFVEFGIPRAQLAQEEQDMLNNNKMAMPKQRIKKLERKDWNEFEDISAPIPKPRKKKKHSANDFVDGRKVDQNRYNEVLSPVTATGTGIPRDAPLFVNTNMVLQKPLYVSTLPISSPKTIKQPIYVNTPQVTLPVSTQPIYVNTPPVLQPSKPLKSQQIGPSNDTIPLGNSQILPHRFIPNYTPEEGDNDTTHDSTASSEPDFDELSRFRAHGHNKRAPPPPPPVPPHRNLTSMNEIDLSSELSSTSRALSRYTGDSVSSIFGRHDLTLTGKRNNVQWSVEPKGASSRQRKTSAISYNTHASWKTTGTLIAKRHPEDAGVDELTFGISEYVIDSSRKGPGSVLITGGVTNENRSTFESEVLY